MSNLTHEPYAYIHGLGYYLSVQIGPVLWQYGMPLEQFLKEKASPSFDMKHPYFWLNPNTQKYESFPDKQSLREALTPPRKCPLIKADPEDFQGDPEFDRRVREAVEKMLKEQV